LKSGVGLKTIAAFVENQQILDKLKEIGVDYAQGYNIDRSNSIKIKNKLANTEELLA